MKSRFIIASALSAAVMVAPVQRANAGDAGAVAVGVGLGILGTLAVQDANKRKRATTTRRSSCGATCQQNREMQAALNHFGYNAGPVDGVPGSRTRSAVRSYESQMGFYADGNLDPTERDFLMNAYYRSTSGNYGPHAQAYYNGGNAGFLRSLNDERVGRFNPGATAPVYGNAGVPNNAGVQPNAAPQFGGVDNGGTYVGAQPAINNQPQQPNPFGNTSTGLTGFNVTPVAQSMSAHCAETQQLTVTNGGYVQAASAANAAQALSEQFCLAKDFSTSKGQQIISSISGMTAADVSAQCQQFVTALNPAIAALGTQQRAGVVQQVNQIVGGQLDQPTMANAGQICLAMGYTEDDPKMAIAGALLLTAAGQQSYGEIVGHHLREGFGVTANAQLAKSWHMETISAMDSGAPAEILPSQAPQRNAVIKAAYSGAQPASTASAGNTLPTFVVQPSQ